MAAKPNTTSALDAFLASVGRPELSKLGGPVTQPKALAKKKGSQEPADMATGKSDESNAELLMYQNNAADAADKLHTALNQLKDGTIEKSQVEKIFADYTAAQDKLYAVDAPSATKLQSTFFTPSAALGSSGSKPSVTPAGSTTDTGPRWDAQGNNLVPGTAAYASGLTIEPAAQKIGTPPVSGGLPGSTPPKSNTPTTGSPFTPVTRKSTDKVTGPYTDNQIAQQYGAMGSYALTMPWMKDLMLEGATKGWLPAEFANKVQNYVTPDGSGTHPWAAIEATIRNSALNFYADPAQWGKDYNSQLAIIKANAVTQGLDPSAFGNPIDLKDPASITAAFNDASNPMTVFQNHFYGQVPTGDVLNQYIANHSTFAKTDVGAYAGVLGQNADILRKYASDMGVAATYLPQSTTSGPNTGDYFANGAKAIQDGTTTLEEQQNYIKQQAMTMYQPYARRISEGMSVRALASPYLNATQNLMEVGADGIDLGSTTGLGLTVTKAMQGTNGVSTPLDQYMTQLKQSPDWLKTANARDSLQDTANTILHQFGLVN